jgi:polyisoprenyl-phosphate glycosyltransferase
MTMEAPRLSIVCPVYGSPNTLDELCRRIRSVAETIHASYEIILVDDRCPKGSWQVVTKLAEADPRIIGLRLSRNFGQHPAIYAGLKHARGEWIVVMDCDLQDLPEEIGKLYAVASEGYDAVRARRIDRKDSAARKLASLLFYRTLSYLTGVAHSEEIGNFGIYSRKVIDAVLQLNEDHLYFPTSVRWVGFSIADVEVAHAPRRLGVSSYNFRRLARLATRSIISFSDKPLRLLAYGGLLIALLAFLFTLYLVASALIRGIVVPGWTSVIASLWLLSGMIIFCIGFSGLYIGQILREVKRRPNSIIDEIAGGLKRAGS